MYYLMTASDGVRWQCCLEGPAGANHRNRVGQHGLVQCNLYNTHYYSICILQDYNRVPLLCSKVLFYSDINARGIYLYRVQSISAEKYLTLLCILLVQTWRTRMRIAVGPPALPHSPYSTRIEFTA